MVRPRKTAPLRVLCVAALTLGSLCLAAQAQSGKWTLVNGSSTATYVQGAWGKQGTAAQGNNPGSRQSPATWIDSSGNLWLFGGQGNDLNGNFGALNDLWEFSPSTGYWTWVSGSNTLDGNGLEPGTYGKPDVAASGNVPGGRSLAVSWIDTSGNLWLFGGLGCDSTDADGVGPLNDLWMYNPTAKEWTWVSGSSTLPDASQFDGQPGVYGMQGSAATANVPGGRSDAISWTDSNGNFWLFGGVGGAGATSPAGGYLLYFNDLWKFNPGSSEWTWVSGNNLLYSSTNPLCGTSQYYTLGGSCYQVGMYGQSPTTNVPGGRQDAVSWIDASGNLWLFGGYYQDFYDDLNWFNDLWQFNPATSEWAWVSGSNMALDDNDNTGDNFFQGVYGTQGFADPGNVPGSRQFGNGWIDSSGNLWLFGGEGYDSTYSPNAGNFGDLNDLWSFSPATGNWTWFGGSENFTTFPNFLFGTQGTYSTPGAATNFPGGRYGSGSWTDSNGNFWLFGGNGDSSNIYAISGCYNSPSCTAGIGELNDLWEFQFTVPTTALPVFNPAAGTYVGAQPVTINDSTHGATIYYTTDGSTPSISSYTGSGASPVALTVASSETVKAIAVASNYNESYVATAAYTIQNATAAPSFNLLGGTYGGTQSVKISDSTPGATIYYTTNGSTPSASSYAGFGASPIMLTVSASETIKAIAVASGYANSSVVAETYTILPPTTTPIISPSAGTYTTYPSVTITDSTTGATIYYTTNGLPPTTSSTKYTGSFLLTSSATVQAIAVATGYYTSAPASAAYTLNLPTPALTALSPAYVSGSTAFTLTVNGTNFTSLSTIYWDAGSGPAAQTTTYVSPTQLTARIAAAQVSAANGSGYTTYTVTVETPGTANSNALNFLVVSPNSSSLPLDITPVTVTVEPGASVTLALSTSLPSSSGILGPYVGCLNLPAGANCTFGISTNSNTSGTVTISTSSTTPAGTYLITVFCNGTIPVTTASNSIVGIVVSAFLLPLLFLRRRIKARSVWLMVCVGLALSTFLMSCGGGKPSVGTTTVTTEATNATTITLTVQ